MGADHLSDQGIPSGRHAQPAPEAERPLTVSQLTQQVRLLLEDRFPAVWVEGEISNWTVAASGHAYFALKDDGALLSCVMWRSSLMRVGKALRDGDHVEARGRLSVFDKRGQYQMVVESLRPVGEGLLWQRFQELKAKLEAEGLFDPARKRPIPRFPAAVGVITSPTGAAIRDILSVLERRAPGLPVYVWPARVQGEGAARELADGVAKLARSGLVDVLIVGRGGGSFEDLWQFNDEKLARAIVACPVPVISAVGHEVDFSICDFVADLRAPTPSAAAELVSADQAALRGRIEELRSRIDRAALGGLAELKARVRSAASSYALRQPENRLREFQQRVDEGLRRGDLALERRLTALRGRVESAGAALQGHDPALILQKGYAILRRVRDGHVITRAAALRPGAHFHAQLTDGRIRAIVTQDAPDLFENS